MRALSRSRSNPPFLRVLDQLAHVEFAGDRTLARLLGADSDLPDAMQEGFLRARRGIALESWLDGEPELEGEAS